MAGALDGSGQELGIRPRGARRTRPWLSFWDGAFGTELLRVELLRSFCAARVPGNTEGPPLHETDGEFSGLSNPTCSMGNHATRKEKFEEQPKGQPREQRERHHQDAYAK